MLMYRNGRVGSLQSEEGSALTPAYSTSAAIPSVVFAGHSLAFSDTLLQLVSEEYPDFDVVRVETLDQIAVMSAARRNLVQILIVDEGAARVLPIQGTSIEALLPGARIVLGYKAVGDARQILGDCMERRVELRCLPMNAPIDAWLATLKLILLGQVFVPEELLDIERRAVTTEAVFSDDLASPIANGVQEEPVSDNPSFRKLTKREKEILSLLSCGERNKAIARRLGLSEHTVKLHVHHIFGKIGVQNRTSATHWYLLHSKSELPEENA